MAEGINSTKSEVPSRARLLAAAGAMLAAVSLVGCEVQATAEKPKKTKPVTIQEPTHDGVVVAQNVNVRSTPKVINKSPERPGRDDNIMYKVGDEPLFLLRSTLVDADKRKNSTDYWLKFKDEKGSIGFIALTQLAYQENDLGSNYVTVYNFTKPALLPAEHEKLKVAPGITEDILKTTVNSFTVNPDEEISMGTLMSRQEVKQELKDLGLR